MKKKAVLFDLFGTIVPGFSRALYHKNLDEMASIWDFDSELLKERWLSDTKNRGRGIYKDIPDVIHSYTGIPIDDPRVKKATVSRTEMTLRSLEPKAETLETLSTLKERGYKLALVSNCSQEVPLLFESSTMRPFFDALIYSAEVGVMKPHPKIYEKALEALDVNPEDAVFVGDGDCDELGGALKVGILPIQVSTGVPDSFKLSDDREDITDKITDLRELLTLI